MRTPAKPPGTPDARSGGEPPRAGRRGFSLGELLVVLVVVGVMAGLIAPRIEVVRYRMDGSSRGAAMALVSAQRQAVHRQHNVIVAFDVANNRIRIHEDRNNNGEIDPGERVRWVPLQESVLFGLGSAPPRGDWAGAVSFMGRQGDLPAIRFLRTGSASEEGTFYLTSERSERDQRFARDSRSIHVDRGTGRVSWFHFDPPEWRQGF